MEESRWPRDPEGSSRDLPKASRATARQHPSGWTSGLPHQVWGVLTTGGASSESSMGNLLRSTCPHGRCSGLQSDPRDGDRTEPHLSTPHPLHPTA